MGELKVWLRLQRERALLSQAELACRAGLSVRTIGNLERGQGRRPHPATLRAIAIALAAATGEDEVTVLLETASLWMGTRGGATSVRCPAG